MSCCRPHGMWKLKKSVLRHCQQQEKVILWWTFFAEKNTAVGGITVKHTNCFRKHAFCRFLILHLFLNACMYLKGDVSLQWVNCTVAGVLFRVCFCFVFVIQTLIPHVCKASPLSPKEQQWSCGARWHNPVTQTQRRLHSDSGNRPPKQKSSIIYVQQLYSLI